MRRKKQSAKNETPQKPSLVATTPNNKRQQSVNQEKSDRGDLIRNNNKGKGSTGGQKGVGSPGLSVCRMVSWIVGGTLISALLAGLLTLAFALWLGGFTHPGHVIPRHHHQPGPDYFQNQEGLWLYTRSWLPQEGAKIRGVLFFAHGFGDHCSRQVVIAETWNSAGYAVFCLDHQGHGLSEGERAYVQNFDNYVNDYLQFINFTFSRYPQYEHQPRFLAGASMGGAISLVLALNNPRMFNGLLLLAPAIVIDEKSASPLQIKIAKLLADYLPKFPVGGLDHTAMTRDKDMVNWYLADPLTYKGYATARWAVSLLDAMDHISNNAHLLETPFWVIYGDLDVATNPAGADLLVAKAKTQDRTYRKVAGLRHAITVEPERYTFLREMIEWANARR